MVFLIFSGSVESAEIAISNVYRKEGTIDSRFSLTSRIRLRNDRYQVNKRCKKTNCWMELNRKSFIFMFSKKEKDVWQLRERTAPNNPMPVES
jgi:hypothetical protein